MASTGPSQIRARDLPADGGAGSAGRGVSAGTAIVADVDAALRALPSHGAARGWTGRRDRALLVLSQVAGLSSQSIIDLTAGDITVSGGVATIRTPGGSTVLRRNDDVVICCPCALARWLHALDLTVVHSAASAASVIARCAPLTARSPHLCEGDLHLAPVTCAMPVLPVTDSWGPHPRHLAGPARGPRPELRPHPRRDPERHPWAGAESAGPGRGVDRTGPEGGGHRPGGAFPVQRAGGSKPTTQGQALRLSRYPDPMEPTAARRLRQGLERTAGELTAWERSGRRPGTSPSVTTAGR